jgi:hypothetical protein
VDGVIDASITVVTSIDLEMLANLIAMEKSDEDSVGNYTDEIVMNFLEYTQELDASVPAEFVKAELLARGTRMGSRGGRRFSIPGVFTALAPCNRSLTYRYK